MRQQGLVEKSNKDVEPEAEAEAEAEAESINGKNLPLKLLFTILEMFNFFLTKLNQIWSWDYRMAEVDWDFRTKSGRDISFITFIYKSAMCSGGGTKF